MTTQWQSSDQARQLSCLVASGAIEVCNNRDVLPDRVIQLEPTEERVTVNVPDPTERLAAMNVLAAANLHPVCFGTRVSYLEVAA